MKVPKDVRANATPIMIILAIVPVLIYAFLSFYKEESTYSTLTLVHPAPNA